MCTADLQTKFIKKLLSGFDRRSGESGWLDTDITDIGDFADCAFVVRTCGFAAMGAGIKKSSFG